MVTFGTFLGTLGYIRHRNARKSLKQAIWNHFELILASFLRFFCNFHDFLPILIYFSTLKDNY
jgi:hypothetical protein